MTTLLTEDDTAPDYERKAEERRAEGFRAQRTWHEKPLLWTISRETLYFMLRTPAPRLSDEALQAIRTAQEAKGSAGHAALQQRAQELLTASAAEAGPDNAFYRNATIILYLAAHQSEDWQRYTHDRKLFLNAIEKWIDDNVFPGEMVKVADVTNQLIEDAETNRAIGRPSGAPSAESGN